MQTLRLALEYALSESLDMKNHAPGFEAKGWMRLFAAETPHAAGAMC
jgi:hypothetical protein